MKQIRTEDAVGHVLCHDITRIVKDVTKGVAFYKGHIVTREDIPALLSLGKEHLYVWEKQEGMLHEDEAADILYSICGGENMSPTPVKEGKIEAIADCDGLLVVDVEKLKAVNSMGEMMIATRHSCTPVKAGDKLAGTRIIPLVISEEKMQRVKDMAGDAPILSLKPFVHKNVGVVTTGSEVYTGRIKDTFTPVLVAKLAEYGSVVTEHALVGDDHEVITGAVLDMLAKGVDMVLCSGGMSVDPDDRTPLAIKNTGARVVSYGAPVLPGAMFMLGYMPGGVPVMGLPGCVMYARRTIFDIVLPRALADVEVTAADLAALGHGGLCLECADCTYPVCGFGKGV